jgi:NitT/TauT family transport system substrate-binding protein
LRLLATLWAAVSALGVAASAAEPVRIALVREASAAPLYIAVAAGYFQAEGLEPRLDFLPNPASVSAAVASGKADVGFSALSAPFYGYAAAHGLKMIASQASDQAGFPMYALLIGKNTREGGFSELRGLEGARVGIARSEPGAAYGLFNIATRFGLAPERIKVVWLKSTGSELKALSRSDIDAAVLPFATAIQSAGKGASLLRLSDLASWQQGVVFASAKKIATKRSLFERFVRAYQRGAADYHLNFLHYDDAGDFIPGPLYGAYLDLIARQAHVSAAMLAKTKTYCDRRANLDVADIGKQVQFWQDQGRLDRRIAAADLLDVSFIGEEPVAAQSPGSAMALRQRR